MTMILRPFDEFRQPNNLTILWLSTDDRNQQIPEAWCRLWNSCPRRFCTDGAANRLHILCEAKRTLHPTVISGDFDSIEQKSLDYFKSMSTILKTPDQDYTDLSKALRLIADSPESNNGETRSILILGGLNGRFDHTLSTLNSMLTFITEKRLACYVVDANNLVTIIPHGATEIYIDRSHLTGKCGLMPLCQRETQVSTQGFQWNLTNQLLEYGGVISSCNIVVDERLRIETTTPIVFTCELKSPEMLVN
ncbi:Thiamine pyrophosphokinase [Aphelenchoides besseyi]|nr:Thiamine pyrophosphokinase [Aphelenchoides besseyi]KAI6208741.1 Thiamine pyrophosphokinase [Aphelenchoides besseyi]